MRVCSRIYLDGCQDCAEVKCGLPRPLLNCARIRTACVRATKFGVCVPLCCSHNHSKPGARLYCAAHARGNVN